MISSVLASNRRTARNGSVYYQESLKIAKTFTTKTFLPTLSKFYRKGGKILIIGMINS